MRLITDPEEIREAESYMNIASIQAKRSKCCKSKRGAIIVKDGKILGKGHNRPQLEELCNPCIREHIKDNSRVELCSAIHAEQMAIIDAVNKSLFGSRMYHIKVKDGIMRTSGKPSCTVCSRMIYEAEISEVVLWHPEGYVVYSAREFNQLSFDYFTLKQP